MEQGSLRKCYRGCGRRGLRTAPGETKEEDGQLKESTAPQLALFTPGAVRRGLAGQCRERAGGPGRGMDFLRVQQSWPRTPGLLTPEGRSWGCPSLLGSGLVLWSVWGLLRKSLDKRRTSSPSTLQPLTGRARPCPSLRRSAPGGPSWGWTGL